MSEVYLSIDETVFDKERKKAKETAIEDGCEGSLVWEDIKLDLSEPGSVTFEDGEIRIGGDIGDLGYITITAKLDIETMIDVIEHSIKQANKIKTVLEATK